MNTASNFSAEKWVFENFEGLWPDEITFELGDGRDMVSLLHVLPVLDLQMGKVKYPSLKLFQISNQNHNSIRIKMYFKISISYIFTALLV